MATALNDLIGPSGGDRQALRRTGQAPAAARRVRPTSMQLVAHLDGRYVELHILTDGGESIVVSCPGDSIFALQQHIEQISRQCPEILEWTVNSHTVIDVAPPRIAGR